jgi:glycerophosphoryl diester phosphodiesterase
MFAIAHRGYSSLYPENTALAFEKAIEVGADYIETDLRFSSDGVIVCCHDDNFERLGGGPVQVDQLSFADIQKLNFHGGLEILRLEDVFRIAAGRAKVMLDVKIPTAEMAEQALALADTLKMADHIMVGARTPEMATLVRKIRPATNVLAMPKNDDDVKTFLGLPVDAIRLYEDALEPQMLAAIEAAKQPLWVTGGRRPLGEQSGDMTFERLDRLEAIKAAAVLINDPTLITARRANAKQPLKDC